MIRELVLLSLLITVLAQWDMADHQSKRSKIYCGDELTKALLLICDGLYNSPFKKSYQFPDLTMLDSLEHADSYYKIPFHPKARALSAFEYRRLRRGVHDECCRKSCSINEIKGYCLKRS